MGKLIAGIVAVICVHVGLAAYIASTSKPDAAVRNDVGSSFDTITAEHRESELALGDTINDTEDQSMSTPAINRREPAMRRELISNPMIRSVAMVRRARSPLERKKPADVYALSRPVIITYERHLPAAKADRHYVVDRSTGFAESRKPERRSFIASTLPIIKKPWDWLKFIGSKMK